MKNIYIIPLFIICISFVSAEVLNIGYSKIIDTSVENSNPDFNFGDYSVLRIYHNISGDIRATYFSVNISEIPDDSYIAEAILYMKKSAGDSSSTKIYNMFSSFNESYITWNNQPCGTNFGNSTNCNLTSESNIVEISAPLYSFNITYSLKKAYLAGNDIISYVFIPDNSGQSIVFYSSETPNPANSPYINITYSTACSESLVNTSWSDWTAMTSCLANNTIQQNRSLVQYDENNCGTYENVTFWEYREVACDYCTPSLVNTSWGSWYSITECEDNVYIRQRNLTQYDENNCGEVANVTFFQNQSVLCSATSTYVSELFGYGKTHALLSSSSITTNVSISNYSNFSGYSDYCGSCNFSNYSISSNNSDYLDGYDSSVFARLDQDNDFNYNNLIKLGGVQTAVLRMISYTSEMDNDLWIAVTGQDDDYNLILDVNNGSRNLVIAGDSKIDQDTSTTGSPIFNNVNITGLIYGNGSQLVGLPTTNLSGYIPYTGATSDVNLGEKYMTGRGFLSNGSGVVMFKSLLYNNNSGFASFGASNSISENVGFGLISYGSNYSGTAFGLSKANLSRFYSYGSPLAIGTWQGYNLTLGTNDTSALTIDTNQDIYIKNDTFIYGELTFYNASASASTIISQLASGFKIAPTFGGQVFIEGDLKNTQSSLITGFGELDIPSINGISQLSVVDDKIKVDAYGVYPNSGDYAIGSSWNDWKTGYIEKLYINDMITMDDNDKIMFGTGDDAYITYDGSNLIFNTSKVGTGLAYFSKNVSATGYITRTPKLSNYDGDMLKDVPLPDSILEVDGSLSKTFLLDGEGVSNSVKYSCENVTRIVEYCYDEIHIISEKINYSIPVCSAKKPDVEKFRNITEVEEVCDVSNLEGSYMVDAVASNNRILISELKQKNENIKTCISTSKDMNELKLCINK